MVGQLGLSVEDADAGGGSEQGQRLADVGVGDRVEIAVEADVRRLAGADGAHQVGLEGIGGQREQAGFLLGPDVGDAAVGLVGVRPPVGDLVAPASELGVRTGPGREVVVAGEVEQAGMKLDGGAAAVEHGAAQVVVDQVAGTASQRLEGVDVSSEEALQRLVVSEQRGQRPRVAEDHGGSGNMKRDPVAT